MTVYDFLSLCCDDSSKCSIWDCKTEETVFDGSMSDAMFSEYADYEVLSFDSPGYYFICLNIDTSDD